MLVSLNRPPPPIGHHRRLWPSLHSRRKLCLCLRLLWQHRRPDAAISLLQQNINVAPPLPFPRISGYRPAANSNVIFPLVIAPPPPRFAAPPSSASIGRRRPWLPLLSPSLMPRAHECSPEQKIGCLYNRFDLVKSKLQLNLHLSWVISFQ